jgi:hypothetical protein
MLRLISQGGPPVWFILIFGASALAAAALFVRRPDDSKLGFLRAMSWAQIFTMIAGFAGGVARSIQGIHALPPAKRADWPLYLLFGTGEALADVILGASLLALAWFITAVGMRRLAARDTTRV